MTFVSPIERVVPKDMVRKSHLMGMPVIPSPESD